MKQILLFFLATILFACNEKEQNPIPISIDFSSDIVKQESYIVTKNQLIISIDGVADEASWQAAKFTNNFIDIEGIKKPQFNTKAKMLWDENYFYVYAEMEESHIWADITQRDAIIYLNNDFEIFIAPSMATSLYSEIEINALGTVWDLLLNKPYRSGGNAIFYWNLNNLKSAVKIYGSLNDPSDTDSLWAIEMAIPMKSLIELKIQKAKFPSEGEQWQVNFSRVDWQHDIIDGIYRRKTENGKILKEQNWVWSNQKVINMHEPEKWGHIQFTNETTVENLKFIEDKHRNLKQLAYALFRQTQFASLQKLLQNEVGHTQNINAKYSENDSILATFYKTNFGFEYKIQIPETSQYLLINEAGVLKVIKNE